MGNIVRHGLYQRVKVHRLGLEFIPSIKTYTKCTVVRCGSHWDGSPQDGHRDK